MKRRRLSDGASGSHRSSRPAASSAAGVQARADSPPRIAESVSAEEVARFYEHLQALVRHYQRRDRSRRACGGLSPNECYALEALIRHQELQLDGLARELGLPKPTASRLVAELVARGLVARTADPGDARRIRLRLTPAGATAHAAAVDAVQQDQAALLARFPAATRAAFGELLAGLTAQARSRGGDETG